MDSVEEVKPSSTENIRKSIGSANDIIIEHAYSEEQDKDNNVEPNEPTQSPASPEPEEAGAEDTALNLNETLITPEPELTKASQEKVEPVPEKVKSRELKSLLEAAKESNLDTNIAYKRESRKSTDPYNSKTSSDSQESGGKRTMRSQNPEFVARHKKFLHKVNKSETNSDGVVQDNEMQSQRKDKDNASLPKTPKRKKENFADDAVGGSSVEEVKKSRKSMKVDVLTTINMKKDKDRFCWRCHREGLLVQCETCPRAYHTRCLKQPVLNPDRWPCPECLAILQAESTKTRSPAMRDMSLEHLCELLKYAAKRMIGCAGSEPFIHPVDLKAFPDYRQYVVQPMDLTTIQNNIRNNVYGSTVAFMADAKWILHNSIIFNSCMNQSKLTSAAKSIVKICKQEMSEIETCSECYQNANTKKNSWFVEVCTKPHILLWAKLKGFPYWPAKAMTTNPAGLVDVRFFGAHDRAWIPVKECFLYSKKDPNTTNKNKRNNIAECIKEVDVHIEKLKEKFGEFYYAPYRTPYDPNTEPEQLAFMIPKYKPSPKTSPTKITITPIKMAKAENGEDTKPHRKPGKPKSRESTDHQDESEAKRPKSRASSEVSDGKRSDLQVPTDFSEETEILSSSSKTSLISDDKNDKRSLNFSTQDFDKFMEGYGTEDDDTPIVLNNEARKKIIKLQYDSDSDDDTTKTINSSSSINEDMKNGSEENDKECDEEDKSLDSLSESVVNLGKVRTRGGYHNVTGKVKVIGSRPSTESSRKRSLNSSPSQFESPMKVSRRNSDISTKSDSSRISGISDKISRVEEFSDTLEVSLANTSKDAATVSFSENSTPEKKSRPEFIPTNDKADLGKLKPVVQVSTGDLYNKNKEFRISPQNKSVSIADRLMKKITESELSTEIEKVESVKKQILDSLESCSSAQVEVVIDNSQTSDDVSSSDNNDDKEKESDSSVTDDNTSLQDIVEAMKHSKENGDHSYSTVIDTDAADKNQNVSSSTESSPEKVENGEVTNDEDKETNEPTTEVEEEKPVEEPQTVEKEVTAKESEIPPKETADEKEKVPEITETKSVTEPTTEPNNVSDAPDEDSRMEVDSAEEDSSDDENDAEPTTTNNNIRNSHVKIVNVSDIISGKINDKAAPEVTPPTKTTTTDTAKQAKPTEPESITESIEIKSEPMSEDEEDPDEIDTPESGAKPVYDVTLTVLDKQKKGKTALTEPADKAKGSFKVVDNLTRVIDSVASNYSKQYEGPDKNKNASPNVNRKEITLRPISKLIQSPKQKARKTFPNSPHKMQQGPVQIKKIAEKKDTVIKPATSVALKVVSTLQSVTSQVVTTATTSLSKENMVYIAPQTNTVMSNMTLLPPNQPITLTQNVGSPILAMMQHPGGLNTPGLIIQQNPSLPLTTQMTTPSTSQCAIITQPMETNTSSVGSAPTPQAQLDQNVQSDERGVIPDNIAKAIGDLLCKPPPKLKPRPPGPLATYFDEGASSTAGPATKIINSVAHRFSDYFRGLLKETLQDLSAIGSPESKIRCLELEVEALKQKHAEEMLELRKNISSILKDIQKSIVEEKAKIVDETRASCELERVRCVEEAKSKQWCAFCLKEAQFYCCWNTSYCDYPCQQKHWATHMKTCSQTTVRNVPSVGNSPGSSSGDKSGSTVNPATKQVSKHTYGNNKTVLKQARMIVKQTNKQGVPMFHVPVQRPIQPGQQTITLVESTPGNFEIVGNHGPISLGGKLVPTTTIKVKPGNLITVASSSSSSTSTTGAGTQKTIFLSQKAPSAPNKTNNENKT